MKLIVVAIVIAAFGLLLWSCNAPSIAQKSKSADSPLKSCPASPNCVSSAANDDRHRIEPFHLQLDPQKAWPEIRKTILELERTKIITATDSYLHVECRSSVFKFVDDLELFLQTDQRLIQIRSAARLGYYDFGVNRKRVEDLRLRLKTSGIIR